MMKEICIIGTAMMIARMQPEKQRVGIGFFY